MIIFLVWVRDSLFLFPPPNPHPQYFLYLKVNPNSFDAINNSKTLFYKQMITWSKNLNVTVVIDTVKNNDLHTIKIFKFRISQ